MCEARRARKDRGAHAGLGWAEAGNTDERAVAVHVGGIVEKVRHVYGAGKLVDEVIGGKR